jgi:hypothetical protein
LRHHLRDLERRVELAIVYQPFGRPLEPRGEARRDRKAIRMVLQREMILVGIGDTERLSCRSRDEAHFGGQNGGQGGGDGTLAATVDPQYANVEGHASTPLPARDL